MGRIGEKGFRAILRHERIAQLPLLMETPQDERRSDTEELAYVRALIAG
jgi:deoxyribonuclease IV